MREGLLTVLWPVSWERKSLYEPRYDDGVIPDINLDLALLLADLSQEHITCEESSPRTSRCISLVLDTFPGAAAPSALCSQVKRSKLTFTVYNIHE